MVTLVDSEKFLKRFSALCHTAPEIFMSGFVWQGFGIASGYSNTSASYFFITGFGAALGLMVTHILMNIQFLDGVPVVPRRARNKATVKFLALFFGSATTWQKIANDTHNYGMNFTQAFFFMWFTSFLLFLLVLTVLRLCNTALKTYLNVENDMATVYQRYYYDIQLSVSVSLADAFFLGTSSGFYTDNALGGLFGVTSDTPPFESMVKAGASVLMGFLVSQLVQCVFLEDSWLDRDPPVLPDNKVPLIL